MDLHLIHRVDAFLPHLAQRQPELLEMLPEEEQPGPDEPLDQWVLNLPHPRLMEICAQWVLRSLQLLRSTSPLSNVLLRGCLLLEGEFALGDAAAVAVGETLAPGDPRREEVRNALLSAERLGMLIHLPSSERYCVPFPVRLSFEGVDFLDPLEHETLRLRLVRHHALASRELAHLEPTEVLRHWRFPNLIGAYEMAVAMMEEVLGFAGQPWEDQPEHLADVPRELALPLEDFAWSLGRAIVFRRSERGARLLAASAGAAASMEAAPSQALAFSLLGQFHLRRGRYAKAAKTFGLWEAVCRRENDREGVVLALSAAGMAQRDAGEKAAGAKTLLRASSYARHAGLVEQRIDTANCGAKLLLELERPRDAAEFLRHVAEDLAGQGRRFPAFAELLTHYGRALRLTSAPAQEVKAFLSDALTLAQNFPHRPAEASAGYEMGLLCQGLGHHREAHRWLRRSAQIFQEIDDRAGHCDALIALASTHLALEDTQEARVLLEKTLKVARAARLHRPAAHAARQLGTLAEQRAESGTALAYFSREAEALRFTENAADLVQCHLRLARLYLQRDALMAAGTAALRAQGLARAHLPAIPENLEETFARVQNHLTPPQLEFLVNQVTDELEGGLLLAVKS